MTTIQKARFCHIDLIESIAIFFVVTYHCALYSTDILASPSIFVYLSYFFSTILSTCVPLFFFANGYLLFSRTFTLKKHVHRMIRILSILFVWPSICVSTIMMIVGTPFSIGSVINHVLNLSREYTVNIFWFLCTLFSIYSLFPALKALYDSNEQSFIFLTALCALFTFGIVLINQILTFTGTVMHHDFKLIDYPIVNLLSPFSNVYGYSFVYFCIGGLAFRHEDVIRAIPKTARQILSVSGILISCTLLFLVGVFYSRYVDHTVWDVVWNGYNSIFTFCNVIFIYILSLDYKKNYRFIQVLSINTLGIYVTHFIIIYLSYIDVRSLSFMCNPFMTMIYASLVISICLVLCFVIKKIPLLKNLL